MVVLTWLGTETVEAVGVIECLVNVTSADKKDIGHTHVQTVAWFRPSVLKAQQPQVYQIEHVLNVENKVTSALHAPMAAWPTESKVVISVE